MPFDLVGDILASPWALAAMSVLVFADTFLVVIPGEVAVTALGAIAATTGNPPLWLVIVCAAVAATLGDMLLYSIGRLIGTTRWRWMRTKHVAAAITWASTQLDKRTAVTLFTARFIPFARMAVNLTAGATRVSLPRYALIAALAALGWATYQAGVGAIVASIVPGGPTVAVIVSIVVAVGLGFAIDATVRWIRKRNNR